MDLYLTLSIIIIWYFFNLEVAKGQPYYDAEGNYYDVHPAMHESTAHGSDDPMRALTGNHENSGGALPAKEDDGKDTPLSNTPVPHYYDDFLKRDDVPDFKYLDEAESSKDAVLSPNNINKQGDGDTALTMRHKPYDDDDTLYHHAYKNNATQVPRNQSTLAGFPVRQFNHTFDDVQSGNGSSCDVITHSGCDVIHYERCDPLSGKCRCLNGYLRENALSGVGACKGASFYHGHLTVRAPGVEQSYTQQQLQPIKLRLMTLIQLTFKKQNIQGVLDLAIHSIEKQGQRMTLSFELGMDKALTSGLGDIQNVLSQELMVTPRGDLLLESASREASLNDSEFSRLFSPLVEVNPCIDDEHNYCGDHAVCRYASDMVSCQCQHGYNDPSPNLYRLPGELCVEKCSCHNGGLCVDDDIPLGTKQCSCLKWYFGAQCQIDGKEVMVICLSSLGSLILLGLLLCCCYYGCSRHKDNSVRSRMLHFSPDVSILKLPRVWMDTTTSFQENDTSPPNDRRLSIASENPYFDGYILEDIPLSTLPRHTESHSPYYQATLGHHPATMSSHSFYRY
ncbi:unnamed protein product [Lymnaea stagnalis]|uniref:EGF-like domain-containing protein n=1 Tax=Lymnaea stagnalis TaxID=6523 RepID=A0AAV2I2V2_LYMST